MLIYINIFLLKGGTREFLPCVFINPTAETRNFNINRERRFEKTNSP